MDELFQGLGLNPKDAKIYQLLLEERPKTATQIAQLAKETRTNTYMILERLEKAGLVIVDEQKAVRAYKAAEPTVLKQLFLEQQNKLKQLNTRLNQNLPRLQSLHNLGQLKPGVVYLEGLQGLQIVLNDMTRSGQEVLLIPSRDATQVAEVWEALQKGIAQRAKQGVKTRAIFQEEARDLVDVGLHALQKFEVRYWGAQQYPGEVAVYGDKCVFTAYQPAVVNTILTNKTMADTLRALFEELWEGTKA